MGAALLELVQHAVEWNLGMFTPGDGIDAGSELRIWMGFGVAKGAGVLVCAYLVPRYLYQNRDWKRVLRSDKTLLKGIAVTIGTAALGMGIPEALTAIAIRLDVMDPSLAASWAQWIGLALMIPFMAVAPWGIGLIAGDHSMTLRKSISAMRRRWIWATLLIVVCFIPIAIPHFALIEISYGTSPAALAALLLLDSVVVGFTALVMGSSIWILYRMRVLDAMT